MEANDQFHAPVPFTPNIYFGLGEGLYSWYGRDVSETNFKNVR
jgi:hypothetical protein